MTISPQSKGWLGEEKFSVYLFFFLSLINSTILNRLEYFNKDSIIYEE